MHRPKGVIRCFKVVLDEIKPAVLKRVRRLFAKDSCRAALSDEVEPCGPKVPWIRKPFSFACLGVRLTRARPGPSRKVIWPSGPTHSERPDSDAGKEVALGVRLEVIGVHILN